MVFRNRIVQIVATAIFIAVITLFGFSSYTHQTIEQYAEPHIYRNPSQLPNSQIAYLPISVITELNRSPELQSWLADRLWELHDSGCLSTVVCGGSLSEILHKHGVPVINYPAKATTVHNEVVTLIKDLNPSSLLIIADENYLEQGLYSLKTLNVKAAGWDYRRNHGEGLYPAQYLSHVRLYFDCEFSRPNPLIANPRYTLDIQH